MPCAGCKAFSFLYLPPPRALLLDFFTLEKNAIRPQRDRRHRAVSPIQLPRTGEKSMQFGPNTNPEAPLNNAGKGRIRIVLVEDHAILREGVKALIELESDFEVIGGFFR